MRTFNRISFLMAMAAILMMSFSTPAHAQATDTGDITVTVSSQPITLANETELSFGTVFPYGRAGTVRVTADGMTFPTDAHVSTPGSNANWAVTGIPTAYYAITLPVDGAVSVSNGTEAMAVNHFTHSAGTAPRLDASGIDAFGVGATLEVGANQMAGTYSGSYSVTVAYN